MAISAAMIVSLLLSGAAGRAVTTGNTSTLAEGLITVVAFIALRTLSDHTTQCGRGARIIPDGPLPLVGGDEVRQADLARARVRAGLR